MTEYQINKYNTLGFFKAGNLFISSYIAIDSNNRILPECINRLKNHYGNIKPLNAIKMNNARECSEIQKLAHAILKLIYNPDKSNAGSLFLDRGTNEDEIMLIFEMCYKGCKINQMLKYFFAVANKIDNVGEQGILYIMRDFGPDGNRFYKIGTTNVDKGAEGRLKELKREQYLSDAACVIDQYLFEDRKTADIIEGMLHLVFHKNKISCPNRKQNDKGMLSDKFDETYILSDEDIKSILGRIKMTQDIFNLN